MKMTFTCEHYNWDDFTGRQKEPISKIVFETKSVEITDILADFEMFLRGAGFHFDGIIDVVDPDPVIGCGECDTSAWDSIIDSLKNPPSFRAADLTGKNS